MRKQFCWCGTNHATVEPPETAGWASGSGENSLLRVQHLQTAVEHPDFLIGDLDARSGLGPLGFEGLLLELTDHPVEAGAARSAHRGTPPPSPTDSQL